MVVCGKIVNQDASLGQVHTTPGAAEVSILGVVFNTEMIAHSGLLVLEHTMPS
jgi:hypothetical protein